MRETCFQRSQTGFGYSETGLAIRNLFSAEPNRFRSFVHRAIAETNLAPDRSGSEIGWFGKLWLYLKSYIMEEI